MQQNVTVDGSVRYETAQVGHLFSRVGLAHPMHILGIMKQAALQEDEMTNSGADLDAPIPYKVAQFHGDARPVLEMLAAISEAKLLLSAALDAGHLHGPARTALARRALDLLSNIAKD